MTTLPDRGPWLNYTTHQVACPVGPWYSRSKDALCTCGYTLLVYRALRAESTVTSTDPVPAWVHMAEVPPTDDEPWQPVPHPSPGYRDDLAAAKGCIFGMILGAAMWGVVLGLVWMVFYE